LTFAQTQVSNNEQLFVVADLRLIYETLMLQNWLNIKA
jgi:hypothetical protein